MSIAMGTRLHINIYIYKATSMQICLLLSQNAQSYPLAAGLLPKNKLPLSTSQLCIILYPSKEGFSAIQKEGFIASQWMVTYIYSHDYNYVWLAMQDMVKWASYSVIKMKFFQSYLSLGGKLRCCTKADVIPCPEGNTTSLKYSHAAGALAMSPSFSIGTEPFF